MPTWVSQRNIPQNRPHEIVIGASRNPSPLHDGQYYGGILSVEFGRCTRQGNAHSCICEPCIYLYYTYYTLYVQNWRAEDVYNPSPSVRAAVMDTIHPSQINTYSGAANSMAVVGPTKVDTLRSWVSTFAWYKSQGGVG